MPQGQPLTVPDDGLTTRARRNAPLLAVHTGAGKGKSTAAFGMALRAWNQGFDIAVFQFVKSAKWKVGEEAAFRELGRVHDEHGVGGSVEWHKMGAGWSWSRKHGTDVDHAVAAADGWAEIKRRLAEQRHDFYVLDEFTYPLKWGWVDVDDVIATLTDRPGTQHVVITGRDAPQSLVDAADLVTEMTKVKHPMDVGRKGQKGSSGDPTASARQSHSPANATFASRLARNRGALAGGGGVSTPAVVIAAPASGSGKTTVATGLIGALRQSGHTVAPFKVGPDFIDPGYHALAAHRPGRNLDPVLVGEQLIGPLYRHGSAGADIAIVEGVMGLFDGRIEDSTHRHRAGIHRPRRRSAGRAGDPHRRLPRPEPQHCRTAARIFDVRPVGQDRRGDPQPGRLAAPRGGAAPVLRGRGCAGVGRDPSHRRIIRSIKASRSDHRRRARTAGPRRSRSDDGTGGSTRRPCRYCRRGGRPGHR